MRRCRRIGVSVLFGVLTVALTIVCLGREPGYQGRSLTSWLQQCSDTPLMEKQRLAEAQQAVRAIGAKGALPTLLRMAKAQDGPLRSWVIGQNERLGSHALKIRAAEDSQLLAISGFQALETNGAPAVPKLAGLLDDTNHAFTAVRCLIAIGTPAEAAVARALTNKSVQVRYFATQQFAWVTDDTEDFLAHMEKRLSDTDGSVRFAAAQGIGMQTHAPDSAIPLLLRALHDTQDAVSSCAAKSLADFGSNAARAFPDLSDAVKNGSPNTARQALITLVAIAPDEALPIVFDNFRSADPRRRRPALELLWKYPATNSQVQTAIQQAAADPDPNLARMATELITKNFQAEHSLESQFADEPGYAGRTLGEWLKAHDGEGKFSEDAEQALRHMGTNAIPSLLKRLLYVRPPFGLRAPDVNIDAVRGFIHLRDQALPALPQLEMLMDSTNGDIALHAMLAVCGTGSNAIPFFIKGLTNQFAIVRGEAANFLAQGTGGRYPEQSKAAIPLFVKLLSDPDENVRKSAANEFKEFDPAAAAKAGLK
jgi:HEAT repeat protein